MQLQRTDEWHADRLGRATASRFNDIMATVRSGEPASVKNYRAELAIERITGKPTESFTSAPMQWGIDTEPLARLRFTLATGLTIEECGFYKHPKLMAGASPDGLIGDDTIIEIKCPNSATHIGTLHSQEVPRQYVAQVQGQMWIKRAKKSYFVSFDPRLPEGAQLVIIEVARDDDYIKLLDQRVTDFLKTVDEEVKFIEGYGREVQPSSPERK